MNQTSGLASQNRGILIATVETVGTDTSRLVGAGDVCLYRHDSKHLKYRLHDSIGGMLAKKCPGHQSGLTTR